MKLTPEIAYLAVIVARVIAFLYCFVMCLAALCEFFGGLSD